MRLIILIECIRKLVTKVIGNRLNYICSTHNILRDPNHAGLKNESTDALIHILNKIIKYAKDNNDKLWIIFQDMTKAFDSVDLIPLNRTIEHIKILYNMRRFIIDLFHQRQIRIITKYG